MTKIAIILAVWFSFMTVEHAQAKVHPHHGHKHHHGKIHQQKPVKKDLKGVKGTVPRHFVGCGDIVWNEIGVAGNNYAPFVQKAKANHLSYVVIKAFDGKEWGIKLNGRFKSQLNEQMVKAFHRQGIKCYGYGSTYLHPSSDVGQASIHAINLLHKTSVDGLVMDDVFAYGSDARKAEKLFSCIRQHIDRCGKCRKKTLSFSTFPHLKRHDLPWEIPFRYCDYYLPQLYWADWGKTPEQIVSRFQVDWTNYKRANGNVRTLVIPVAPTTGKCNVTAQDIKRFTVLCNKAGYRDIAYYRWGKTDQSEWRVIKGVATKRTSRK